MALTVNPQVQDVDQAKIILDEMMEAHKKSEWILKIKRLLRIFVPQQLFFSSSMIIMPSVYHSSDDQDNT